MRHILLLPAFIATLALCACLPVTSKVEVGTTVGFKPDPALLGTWRARDADTDTPVYVHILGKEDGSMTAVLVTPPYKQNLGDWSIYALRAATLGTNHILNAQEQIANGKPSSGPLATQPVLLLYRTSGGGKLTLYQLDDKATAAAIRAGEIAGEIDPGDTGDVRITASAAALDKFFASARAAKLFSKVLVTLTRLD
ncbi:MAG TPA: hypothetical protein VGG69_05830 [Rhizomicrobium sp.]